MHQQQQQPGSYNSIECPCGAEICTAPQCIVTGNCQTLKSHGARWAQFRLVSTRWYTSRTVKVNTRRSIARQDGVYMMINPFHMLYPHTSSLYANNRESDPASNHPAFVHIRRNGNLWTCLVITPSRWSAQRLHLSESLFGMCRDVLYTRRSGGAPVRPQITSSSVDLVDHLLYVSTEHTLTRIASIYYDRRPNRVSRIIWHVCNFEN